jgi:hypothetical protein
MSIVDGPPPIHKRIADLRFLLNSAALARMLWPIVRAGMVIADAPAMCFMKWRRLIPFGVLISFYLPV